MTTSQTTEAIELLVTETEPFSALCFTTQATLPTLSQHTGVAEKLYCEADRLRLSATGPIQWIYTGVNGDPANEFQLAIALPIGEAGSEPGQFSYQEFPRFRCASYTYTGSWDNLPALYDTLLNQFYRDGYQNNGRIREIYSVVDLEDPTNCVTEIQLGIN